MVEPTYRLQAKAMHRSFRLSRPGATGVESRLSPALVLPPDVARRLLDAATRADVTLGGRWSVWAAGLQLWSGEWDGPAGSRGSARYLGCVDFSSDHPGPGDLTVRRVRVTAEGVAAGVTVSSLLDRALALAEGG